MDYTPIQVMTRSEIRTMLARQEDYQDFKIFILKPTFRILKHVLDPSSIVAVKDENGITYRRHFTVNNKTHPALLCRPYKAAKA